MGFPFVKSTLERTWKLKGPMEITTDRDLFFIRFSMIEDKQMVLEGGPLFLVGKIFVVWSWSPEIEWQRNNINTVPIWAKIFKVLKELWTKNGLSFLTIFIGEPLSMDGATSEKQGSTLQSLSLVPSAVSLGMQQPNVHPLHLSSVTANISTANPSPASQLVSFEFTEAGHDDTNGQIESAPSSRGPLLATPTLLLRNSTPSGGSLLNSLRGNAPFALRTSSNFAVSRDRHRESNPRGEKNNTYATLVLEEEGIADDDISEHHDEPFDDHNVILNPTQPLRMPSQVTTRAQLQQQQLSGKKGEGSFMLNTDGSVQETGNGFGGIIRDFLGNVTLAYAGSLQKPSVLY
ncbi:hypothetical protein IFM89_030836 [Coptis chinensis]|uniref:DUF4283 domain-containing protein n=1 Tax=Coptis chinensis TaxID=261450 RepID=A0A835I8R2_9MAGN|nr:hypothetical protein IFM89_030836 [Coptis chinensis]